jgi:hypothetical protein
MADAAYDSDRIRKAITDTGTLPVIPNNRMSGIPPPPGSCVLYNFRGLVGLDRLEN